MDSIKYKIIPKSEIFIIIPLLRLTNDKTPTNILKERLIEMSNQNYECIGMYDSQKLIGICGIWYMTRHYIGKSMEVDHAVIDPKYRSNGLGKLFFEWIYEYVKSKGCNASELNTYVNNPKSHKFYYNEGYNIYGFHFLKILREDNKFY
jgi:GNAT superfamily N-acetyltransferase